MIRVLSVRPAARYGKGMNVRQISMSIDHEAAKKLDMAQKLRHMESERLWIKLKNALLENYNRRHGEEVAS